MHRINDLPSLREQRESLANPSRNAYRTSSDYHEEQFSEHPILDDDDEHASLLSAPSQNEPGFISWAASGTWNLVTSAASSLSYPIKHPIVTLTSIVTAAPSALNALVSPSGKNPEELGKQWWDEMTDPTRALSIINSTSSLMINTVMNAFFLPTAWNKFKSSMTHMLDSPKEFIDNLFSIFIAIGGAVAAGAIAYSAFMWLPYGTISAGVPAVISAIVTLASRYIGIKNIFKRIHNLFNDDARKQVQFADALRHINENKLDDVKEQLETILENLFSARDVNTPFSDDEMNQLVADLAQALNDLALNHPDLLNEKTTGEYAKEYAGILFDLAVGLFCAGIPVFPTYMQKGFDGVNTIAKFAGNDLSGLNPWIKRAIGSVPGLATMMMYTDCGTRIRTTLTELAIYLYQQPKEIPLALLALTANGFSATGPYNVASGVVKKPDNITGVNLDNPVLSTTYLILNGIGGGIVNSNSSLNRLFLSSNPDPLHITVDDVAKYLEKVDAHLMQHDTVDVMKDFLSTARQNKLTEQEEDALRRNDSTYFSV